MKKLIAFLLLLIAFQAHAQTATNFATGNPVSSSAVNTAFGGKRDYRQATVDDFKLSGDSDDTASFTRYTAYVRANNASAITLGLNRSYNVSGVIDWTGFAHKTFNGQGSKITMAVGKYAVIDMLNSDTSALKDLTIYCGSQAHPCTNGIQYGRANRTDGGHPQLTWTNVTGDGYYTNGTFHNNGAELFDATGLTGYNHYVSTVCNATATDNCPYVLINDGVDHWPLTSNYVAVSLSHDLFDSFNENLFIKPIFFNYGNGPGVWMSGTHRHKYIRGYIQVQGAGTTPAAVIYDPAGANEGEFQHQLEWDVHTEINPSAEFLMTGNLTPAFFGLAMSNHLVQSNQVFQTDAGTTSVRMYDANFKWSAFLNTTKIFDQPAKYEVDGNLFMLNENAALWNGPAYSGAIHTNSAAAFLTNMTKGSGAFQISDPFSFQQYNITPSFTGEFSVAGGRIIMFSDVNNPNIELDDGTHSASTPYIDFNGLGVNTSFRIVNDLDGQLNFKSDGTAVMTIPKTGQVFVANGLTANTGAISAASFNSSAGLSYTAINSGISSLTISSMVYCLDCLKPGESSGTGTGMWIFKDASNRLFSTAGTLAAH